MFRRGATQTNISTVTSGSSYTVTNEALVIVNKTSGSATTVNLPAGAAFGKMSVLIIIKDGKGDAATNNITITPNGSNTIDGASTLVIATNYGVAQVMWNGTEWNAATSSGQTSGNPSFTTSTSSGRTKAGLLAVGPAPTDTYAATMTIDVTKSLHVLSVSNTTSATVTLTPSAAGSAGDILTLLTTADSSGTVTATFASTFHSSGTQATTASKFSSIVFQSDGTRWYEISRTTALT